MKDILLLVFGFLNAGLAAFLLSLLGQYRQQKQQLEGERERNTQLVKEYRDLHHTSQAILTREREFMLKPVNVNLSAAQVHELATTMRDLVKTMVNGRAN